MKGSVHVNARLFALIALGMTAGCSTSGPSTPPASALPAPGPHAPSGNGYIQHVVVIIQENRSFENLFAGFPGADAPLYGHAFHRHRRIKVNLHETNFEYESEPAAHVAVGDRRMAQRKDGRFPHRPPR